MEPLIALVLVVAVANLLIGYLLSVRYHQFRAAGPVLLPTWSEQPQQPAVVLEPPARPLVELPPQPTETAEPGLPVQWLEALAGLEDSNPFVGATLPVLRLEIGAYREQLVQLDTRVRKLDREIAAGTIHASTVSPDLQAMADELLQTNDRWLEQQKQATDHLRARLGDLGELGPLGVELEQILQAQALQLETTANRLAMAQQREGIVDSRRLLIEIAALIHHCHLLRDAMLASFIEVLRSENRLAEIDPRTLIDRHSGLSNRGGLQQFIDQFRAADPASQRTVSFGWMEIDQLHHVNDCFGPRIGDRLVQAMGQLISSVLRMERDNDLGCRVMGNGFAVFLGDTGPRNATYAVERVRQTIARSTWQVDGVETEITLSGGVIEVFPKDSLDDMITRARAGARQARLAGGNQTWLDEGQGPQAVQAPELKVVELTYELAPRPPQ